MSHGESQDELLDRAASAIRRSEAILIGAGAGMGVDSGLPDFRGDHGFWKAYPPYAKLGLRFTSLANPRWFDSDPELAWGFYGHRLMLYRDTQPHEGFAILHRWTSRMPHGGFVYTSNVDGHFQRAGFSPEQVYEVHGTIGAMQCLAECGVGIFPAESHSVIVEESTMARFPRCRAARSVGGWAGRTSSCSATGGGIPRTPSFSSGDSKPGLPRSTDDRSSSSSAARERPSPLSATPARTSPADTRPL